MRWATSPRGGRCAARWLGLRAGRRSGTRHTLCHAVADGLRASGYSDATIATAMNHAATSSLNYNGWRSGGSGGYGVRVDSARQVRVSGRRLRVGPAAAGGPEAGSDAEPGPDGPGM